MSEDCLESIFDNTWTDMAFDGFENPAQTPVPYAQPKMSKGESIAARNKMTTSTGANVMDSNPYSFQPPAFTTSGYEATPSAGINPVSGAPYQMQPYRYWMAPRPVGYNPMMATQNAPYWMPAQVIPVGYQPPTSQHPQAMQAPYASSGRMGIPPPNPYAVNYTSPFAAAEESNYLPLQQKRQMLMQASAQESKKLLSEQRIKDAAVMFGLGLLTLVAVDVFSSLKK
jgi:hypothetical protein